MKQTVHIEMGRLLVTSVLDYVARGIFENAENAENFSAHDDWSVIEDISRGIEQNRCI